VSNSPAESFERVKPLPALALGHFQVQAKKTGNIRDLAEFAHPSCRAEKYRQYSSQPLRRRLHHGAATPRWRL